MESWVFFLFANSIKIVLKRAGGFVKRTNDNLTIIDDLKKEIQCLKNILNREGISYQEELDQLKNSANAETIETNQEIRIVFPNEITKDMANRFFARFWGRTDVYAKRVENKKTRKQIKRDTIHNVLIFGRMGVARNGMQDFVVKIVITKSIKL